MNFRYHSRFKKEVKKMSPKMKKHLEERLRLLIKNEFDPLLNNHKLHGHFDSYRSINITGDMRLVYKKIDADTILLFELGSHSKLYS
jgi:addiction module RelE/StbE family toxin